MSFKLIMYCRICKSKLYKHYETINEYNILSCIKCGLIFTEYSNKNYHKTVNSRIYNENYLNNYETRKKILINRFKKRIIEIENIKKGGEILDYGCSTGLFIESLLINSRYKWNILGIDINKESILQAKKKLLKAKFVNKNIHKLKLSKNSFDVITCFDVLEHDPFINRTVKHFHYLLKPNGLLIIQSPNYQSVMCKLSGKNWDWWSVPDHVFHFSAFYLINFIRLKGFRIIKIRSWEPFTDYLLNVLGNIRRLIKNKNARKLLIIFSVPLLVVIWIMILPIKNKFYLGGLTYIIAQKEGDE